MFLQMVKKWFAKSSEQTVKYGKIKFIHHRKGYGFIQSADTTKDVFVHVSELKDKVHKGDKVSFQLEINDKGMKAKNVKRQLETA